MMSHHLRHTTQKPAKNLFSYASLPLIPPSPSTPSALHSTFFMSVFHISHTLLLPSCPSLFLSAFHSIQHLPPTSLSLFAQCLPLKTPTFNHNLLVFRVPLSLGAHHNLPFPPFCQPGLIHSINIGPGCSAASGLTATTSLSSFVLCPLLPFST